MRKKCIERRRKIGRGGATESEREIAMEGDLKEEEKQP